MKKDGDIVSYSARELRTMVERGEDRTAWARVDAMTEEELEAAIASDPDWPTSRATVVSTPRRTIRRQ